MYVNYVCIYDVYMYVCMRVFMYVCMQVCMYVCKYACMYVYMLSKMIFVPHGFAPPPSKIPAGAHVCNSIYYIILPYMRTLRLLALARPLIIGVSESWPEGPFLAHLRFISGLRSIA